MGIPLWREPSPPAPKSSVKSDPCAHSRSSIRRRGAIRHVPRADTSSVPPRPSLSLSQIENTLVRSGQRSTLIDEIALFNQTRDTDLMNDSARREAGSRLLRDALRHRQPGRRLRIPRESSLRFEMPSPPWSPDELLQRSSIGDYTRIRQPTDTSPFSPRFAPAYSFRRENSSASANSERRASSTSIPPPQVHVPGLVPPALNMRYLRRVGHRSISETNRDAAASSHPAIDGLGDRQRSTSPEDYLDNTWETLLTTLTPDPNLPSAGSSFASTAASVNTNPSRSTRSAQRSHSSQTQRTLSVPSGSVRMSLEPYPEFFNPCDPPSYATDSDTEAESDLELRRAGSRQRQYLQSRLHDSTSVIGSTQDSQPPIPRVRLSRTSMLPSISSLVSNDLSSGMDMQVIIDHFAQREDTSDGWWVPIRPQIEGRLSPPSADRNRNNTGDET